jgi:hypothetical protein
MTRWLVSCQAQPMAHRVMSFLGRARFYVSCDGLFGLAWKYRVHCSYQRTMPLWQLMYPVAGSSAATPTEFTRSVSTRHMARPYTISFTLPPVNVAFEKLTLVVAMFWR